MAQSVMSHMFSQVPRADIPRSSFDRTHGYKTTFDAGWLVPIFVDEVLPGDTFNLNMTAFARMATPLFPIMDNIFLDSFFFFVPYRLVWDNWVKFNGEQRNPTDSTDFLVPQVTSPSPAGYTLNSLYDYLGLPTNVGGVAHSALPLRAYNLIWNEFFRDQNLQTSVSVPVTDGPDSPTLYTLLRRGKRHDYFTSCLPFPQKGPSVPLPLGSTAPVITNGDAIMTDGTSSRWTNRRLYVDNTTNAVYLEGSAIGAGSVGFIKLDDSDPTGMIADLSMATAATVNQLRQAFQVQRLYERDARGGTRYTEILRAHFGVESPDSRLQRPEYLGGGSTPINITPIAQTSSTDATSPQGNLAAYGTATINGHGFTKSFVEHGIVIGLVSARADLTYQAGLDRFWSRRTRFDFYWPALSHIGEQAVLNKEIYCQGNSSDALVFGYQEAWADYRYKPSKITALFRSNAVGSLDAWHLSQEFASLPLLNDVFIQEDPPIDRVIAVPSQPHFIYDSFIKYKCARPLPLYSVPGMIDHF